MNINFNDFFTIDQCEPFEHLIQIWIGDTVIEEKIVSITENIREQQFKQIASQLSRDSRPMKIRISNKYYKLDGNVNDDYFEFTNKVWDKGEKERELDEK